MSEFAEVWATEKLKQLKMVTDSYSSQEKEQIRLTYLNNLLTKIAEFDLDKEDAIVGQIESVIDALPKEFEEFLSGSYQPIFNDLVFDVKKRFNLIPKNFHRNDFNPLSTARIVGYVMGGIAIYLISMLLKKPALAILFGAILIMLISTVTGIILDKKAQRQNRVL